MLLLCPACATRYVVPDAAIGISGRQVRCANCKHSWFQDGVILPDPPAPAIAAPISAQTAPSAPEAPEAPETAPTPAATPEASPAPGFISFDEAVAQEQSAPPVAAIENAPPTEREFPSFAETPAPEPSPVVFSTMDNDYSQFSHEPPFKPRRNPAKLWTIAAVAFAGLIALISLAIWQFGMPSGGFMMAGKEPDLKIVLSPNLELEQRSDGTPFFVASGTIVNPTAKDAHVPDILVTLKDASGRSVYNWQMKPKTRTLAPGAKLDFSEARLDVPLAARQISLGWVLQ